MTETETPNEDEQRTSPFDSDWDNRVLCSDGNCIGVIGPDGKCKECGKAYEGTLPETGAFGPESPSVSDDDTGADSDSDAHDEPAAAAESVEDVDSDDWSKRRLCVDGNCIGVIGPDGLCKECGKPSE